MKASTRIFIVSILIGLIVAGGIFYVWPNAHWAVYVLILLASAGWIYRELLQQEANEKIINRD